MFDIEEELKKLPGRPGVYIMHDARDEIIYVGKAVNLKKHLSTPETFEFQTVPDAAKSSVRGPCVRFAYVRRPQEGFIPNGNHCI